MAMAQVQWNHFQNLGESASLAADHGGLPFLPNRKLIGASAIPPTPSDGLRNDAGRANQNIDVSLWSLHAVSCWSLSRRIRPRMGSKTTFVFNDGRRRAVRIA